MKVLIDTNVVLDVLRILFNMSLVKVLRLTI
jgi:hypothetical protein